MFEEHNKRMADFDRRLNRAWRLVIGFWLICACSGLAMLGFGIWVIVKLLAHFGVI